MLTNDSGTATARYDYTPFGVMAPSGTVSSGTDYTFSGKEKQRFGAVHDFGARMYDPHNAIWNAVDPKAEKYYSVTPYTYCNNNPVIFVDPDGEYAHIIAGAVIGAAVCGVIAYAEGKTGSELVGAMVGGVIEGGVSMALPVPGLGVAATSKALGPAINFCARYAGNAAVSAVASVAEQVIATGDVDGGTLATDAIVGGAIGTVSSELGTAAKNMLKGEATAAGQNAIRNSVAKENRAHGIPNTNNTLKTTTSEIVQSAKGGESTMEYATSITVSAIEEFWYEIYKNK